MDVSTQAFTVDGTTPIMLPMCFFSIRPYILKKRNDGNPEPKEAPMPLFGVHFSQRVCWLNLNHQ